MPGRIRRNSRENDTERIRMSLMSMLEEDRRVRDQLVAAGTLHDAYHPEMEEVHLSNADRLAAILDRVGWPDSRRFGIDGEDAAWTILMHSISRPALLRQGRELLADAVAQAASAPALLARLEDRIRTLEGRPQRYGTIFDWDGEEQLSPLEVEERDTVDERRASVGLPPLANDIARYRSEATAAGSRPPKDPESKARDLQIWLKRTGWR